jgi:hypothetical protein
MYLRTRVMVGSNKSSDYAVHPLNSIFELQNLKNVLNSIIQLSDIPGR